MAVRESPRARRLRSDLKALERLRDESSIFTFDSVASLSDPPHEYHIRFFGRGLWRTEEANVIPREIHDVTIRLGANYPRMMPELAWRSPVFHPNISSSGVVCLGGYGTFWAPSLHLDEMCQMLWDMARYANYDVKSPYNREAANWVKTRTEYRFPLDPRPLRDRVSQPVVPSTIPEIAAAPVRPPPRPDIQFLGEVIEAEIIEEEVIAPRPPEIFIIE